MAGVPFEEYLLYRSDALHDSNGAMDFVDWLQEGIMTARAELAKFHAQASAHQDALENALAQARARISEAEDALDKKAADYDSAQMDATHYYQGMIKAEQELAQARARIEQLEAALQEIMEKGRYQLPGTMARHFVDIAKAAMEIK